MSQIETDPVLETGAVLETLRGIIRPLVERYRGSCSVFTARGICPCPGAPACPVVAIYKELEDPPERRPPPLGALP